MRAKEKNTDIWVYELLKEAGLKLDPQGSTIKEINRALKSASSMELESRVFLNILEL